MGKGSGIYIKKGNEGKFSEWAKRHGMGVQEAARHVLANRDRYSGAVVKRANFARNAAKFKHAEGGEVLMQFGGDHTQMKAALAAKYGPDWITKASQDELRAYHDAEAQATKAFLRTIQEHNQEANSGTVSEEEQRKAEKNRQKIETQQRKADRQQMSREALQRAEKMPHYASSAEQVRAQLNATYGPGWRDKASSTELQAYGRTAAAEQEEKKRQAELLPYLSARVRLDNIQNETDSIFTKSFNPLHYLSNRQNAGRLFQFMAEKHPELVEREFERGRIAGKGMLVAGKYIFPEAAPVFNAINNGIDAIEFAQNPRDTLNQAQVVSDALSQWKSPRTKMHPFGLMGDALNVAELYRDANKYARGGVSTEGYRNDSPDRFNDFNIIPSNQISMRQVPHPVMGVDDMGNRQMMFPGYQYVFPGNYVMERPVLKGKMQRGGSVVDYLHAQGADASMASRRQLASQLGIGNYRGTAAQNMQLLRMLQSGNADRANQVQRPMPDDDDTAATPAPVVRRAPAKPGDVRPKGGYVNLSDYGVNLYSDDGSYSPEAMEFAKQVQLAHPETKMKFICNESGCTAIANRASLGQTGERLYGEGAWRTTGKSVWRAPVLDDSTADLNAPLPDPTDYSIPAEVRDLKQGYVGLNRKNNKKDGLATTTAQANDSYDYANKKLYPVAPDKKNHNYEHMGYKIDENYLLHGTGAGQGHPAFFVVDDLRDNEISLAGYGKYAPVEVLSTDPKADQIQPMYRAPIVKKGQQLQYQLRPNTKDSEQQRQSKQRLIEYFNNPDLDQQLMASTGISPEDLQGLKPVIMGIMGNETSFNDLPMLRSLKEAVANMRSHPSVGPFEVKLESVPESVRNQFGIKHNADLKKFEKAYPAAMSVLYNALKTTDQAVAEGKQPGLKDKDRYFRAAYAYNMPAITRGGDERIAQLWQQESGGRGTEEEKRQFFEKMRLRMEKGTYPYKAMQYAYDVLPTVVASNQVRKPVAQPAAAPSVAVVPSINAMSQRQLNPFQMGAFRQDGGETSYVPPTNYRPSTPQERTNWNSFLDYLGSKGVAGSTDLDVRDKRLGLTHLKEYNRLNPNAQVPEQFIPTAQYENYLIRRENKFPTLSVDTATLPANMSNLYPFKGLPQAYRERAISPVDSWLGSNTSKEYYPKFTRGKSMRKADGTEQSESYDFGSNFEDYWRSLSDPALEQKYRITPSGVVAAVKQPGGEHQPFRMTNDMAATFLAGTYPGLQNFFQKQQVMSKDNQIPIGMRDETNLNTQAMLDAAPALRKFFQKPKILAKDSPKLMDAPTTGDTTPQTTTIKMMDPYRATLGLAGLSLAGHITGAQDRNRWMDWQRLRGLGDNIGPAVAGSRGDYTTNGGYFRPDQYTPVQFGAVPMAQLGGGYYDPPAEYKPSQREALQKEFEDPYSKMDVLLQQAGAGQAEMPIPQEAIATPPPETNTERHPSVPDIKPNMRVRPNEAAWEAYNYYVDEKGLAPHVAAGIVGNLYQESALRTNVEEKGNTGNGRGIAQWDVRDRWKGLHTWAEKKRLDPYALRTQLDYILEEPGEGKKVLEALKRAQTPEEASYVFGKVYERPSDKYARWDVRAGVARMLFNKGASVAGGPSAAPQDDKAVAKRKLGGVVRYKEGGEYLMTPKQLEFILAHGGEVEFL